MLHVPPDYCNNCAARERSAPPPPPNNASARASAHRFAQVAVRKTGAVQDDS